MIASVVLFVIVYFFIATEKIEKSLAALLGGVFAIGLGLITFEEAVSSIDLNVLFLLIGMMTCVGILAETGFFEWVAIFIAKLMAGSGIRIFIFMLIITMVFSAFLDNVTTIILLAPVTILITQILEIPTMPFLIYEALASNIGGTATLIGDPPNIIIGSKAHLSFSDFIVHLAPGVLMIATVFILTAVFFMRKKLVIPANIKKRVQQSYPKLAIRDFKKMWWSLIVFFMIFTGFFFHHKLHILPGVIALGGMCIMLLVCKSDSEEMLKTVEWDAILFFIGLFMVIGAMEHNGVIEMLADYMLHFCGDNLFVASVIILIGSAAFSAVLDNIPFVIAMTPLVQNLIIKSGGTVDASNPLLWALAFGACLGGNGTIIGASANIVVAKIGMRNGYPITFGKFLVYGVPYTIQAVIIALIYMWLRYF